MELERALSDLEEVRDRLAHVQRFEGYSAPAAAVSGLCALIAGVAQLRIAPHPQTPDDLHAYVAIWLSCLAVALALNYGAVATWVVKRRGPAQSQFRSAARSIAPERRAWRRADLALVAHSAFALLPGTWFALYAIGLFASRGVNPAARALGVRFAFAALAVLFLVTPLRRLRCPGG